MRHVQSLVGADPALRVGLSANSRAVLVVENSRAIRVVCLRVEAALPRVAAPMLEIDLREFDRYDEGDERQTLSFLEKAVERVISKQRL